MSSSPSPSESSTGKADGVFRFQPSQKVFCYHGSLIYDARCIKTSIRDGKPFYLIHYHGWNKNWDEWVDETRVLEYNDDSKKLCEELKVKNRQSANSTKTPKRKTLTTGTPTSGVIKLEKDKDGSTVIINTGGKDGSVLRSSNTTNAPSNKTTTSNDECKEEKTSATTTTKKRKRQKLLRNDLPEKMFTRYNNNIKVEIPEELKLIILDDYNYINNLSMLVNLPANKTVNDILDSYVKCRSASEDSENTELVKEFPFNEIRLQKDPILTNLKFDNLGKLFRKSCYLEVANGLKQYFNVVLGTQLLYKFERIQYHEILQNSIKKSEIQTDAEMGQTSGGVDSKSSTICDNNNKTSTEDGSNSLVQDKFRTRKNSETSSSSNNNANSSGNSSGNTVGQKTKHINTTTTAAISSSITTPSTNKQSNNNSNNNSSSNNNNNNNIKEQEQTNPPSPSSIYGAIHLLRLFTKMGTLLSYFDLDEGFLKLLLHFFADVLQYLNEQRAELFAFNEQYITATPEYLRRSMV